MGKRVTLELDGVELSLERATMASQADGAVLARYGGTTVLVAVTIGEYRGNRGGFLPLRVDYCERAYAVGVIPSGYTRREAYDSEHEILISRVIDRSLRPLFPEDFVYDTQVTAIVLSVDPNTPPDIPAVLAASAAVGLAGLPVTQPIAAVRVGRVEDAYVLNPDYDSLLYSSLNMLVAGMADGITMVEAMCAEISDSNLEGAIEFAVRHIGELVALQQRLFEQERPEPFTYIPYQADQALYREIEADFSLFIRRALSASNRKDGKRAMDKVMEEIEQRYQDRQDERFGQQLTVIIDKLRKKIIRDLVLAEGKRIDGRELAEIRPISATAGVLARTHGSSLFTRGETQSLATVTLGRLNDSIETTDARGKQRTTTFLHYQFPPFATGEAKGLRGTSRREYGHGNLALKALRPVLPNFAEFPYVARIVSEILSSNGSSSMASVCSASLALMDAGVPIKSAVAGIALGLFRDDGVHRIVTDILGPEDAAGNMDMKVAGTRTGITAIQLDVKGEPLPFKIFAAALDKAHASRMLILDKMSAAIAEPNAMVREAVPQVEVLMVPPKRIGWVIGSGGRNITKIREATDTNVDILDDGLVAIYGDDAKKLQKAKMMVMKLADVSETAPPKSILGFFRKSQQAIDSAREGDVLDARVIRIFPFGIFVETSIGVKGPVYLSELGDGTSTRPGDLVKVGDKLEVAILSIDGYKFRFSHRQALERKKAE